MIGFQITQKAFEVDANTSLSVNVHGNNVGVFALCFQIATCRLQVSKQHALIRNVDFCTFVCVCTSIHNFILISGLNLI
jgi:hypothetical protein